MIRQPTVLGVVVYGSHARGDMDQYSDRDVCVFIDAKAEVELERIHRDLAAEYNTTRAGLSLYDRREAAIMTERGSLFLLHLRLEGRVIVDRGGFVRGLLDALRPYCGYQEDVARYREILADLLETAKVREFNEADLHAAFVILRNVLMLLTVRGGEPAFGRRSVWQVAHRLCRKMPIDEQDYLLLSRWHLRYSRGAALDCGARPNASEVRRLLDAICETLDLLETEVAHAP